MAAQAATQLAALEHCAARPTLFLIAFLLAPLAAAKRRRRIRELRAIAALLAALAEAFATPAPAANEAPPPANLNPDCPATTAVRVRPQAHRTISRQPVARANRPRTTRRAITAGHRTDRAPSHTLRPPSRASPVPRPPRLSPLPPTQPPPRAPTGTLPAGPRRW